MNGQEIKEAVEVLKVIPRKPLGNKGQTNLYGIEYESLKVLLTLAQQYLSVKGLPEEELNKILSQAPDEFTEEDISDNEAARRSGYSKAMFDCKKMFHLCRLAQIKKCQECYPGICFKEVR